MKMQGSLEILERIRMPNTDIKEGEEINKKKQLRISLKSIECSSAIELHDNTNYRQYGIWVDN